MPLGSIRLLFLGAKTSTHLGPELQLVKPRIRPLQIYTASHISDDTCHMFRLGPLTKPLAPGAVFYTLAPFSGVHRPCRKVLPVLVPWEKTKDHRESLVQGQR